MVSPDPILSHCVRCSPGELVRIVGHVVGILGCFFLAQGLIKELLREPIDLRFIGARQVRQLAKAHKRIFDEKRDLDHVQLAGAVKVVHAEDDCENEECESLLSTG